jgi:putative DNA methylase
MNAVYEKTQAPMAPGALKNTPTLIETVFPAQKVSFEAQKERKANLGQTLTGLGSYWKGRKPLILVRAIVLGSLLPQTANAEIDLDIFEKLMGFDAEGLVRRALANDGFTPTEIAARVALDDPWKYFSHNIRSDDAEFAAVANRKFPLDCEQEGISIRWKRDVAEQDKLALYRQAMASLGSYEEKATRCKRPEEVDQDWLYAPVWAVVNAHYTEFGIQAFTVQELVEQLGVLRYGHRPRLGDAFSGGGSIPFEAARLGCDVYASDLNPIACMLTWGALNIVGASPERRVEIDEGQRAVAGAVDREIAALGIEQDECGNRAKAYLYCLETRCPETGWLVPMSPTWVVSRAHSVVATLKPSYERKRFDIEVETGVSAATMKAAEVGTVQGGALVYELDGRVHRTPLKTLRGDFRDAKGNGGNRLRRWEKSDFKPRPEDILQERLFAIQWMTNKAAESSRQETFFTAVAPADSVREEKVNQVVSENLAMWQAEGFVPDMAIEPGYNTDQLIRERGWAYWHQLFTPREILTLSTWRKQLSKSNDYVSFSTALNYSSKLCQWITSSARKDASGKQLGGPRDLPNHVFYNQALNTFINYAHRSAAFLTRSILERSVSSHPLKSIASVVETKAANAFSEPCDLIVTDPPYADAVHYHEITEFFIAWLRKNPPSPFDGWIWDSRRAVAIKGSGDDFRRDMVAAYSAMAEHMPDNGIQCVMFTHQDTGVWADMVGIFWAAGLQVVAVWYIATETTSELKKGGYVQGTVILMLKKRPMGERAGFKQRILPAVRAEVERQIQAMMHLNDDVKGKHGEPVFNDSDLQMGGYAAALKVLTAYTHIGGEDVTAFALRPRQRGEVTVVDEIVQQAAEAANNLLVPEDLNPESWGNLNGIQRFYLRMMDMETTGAAKLDNYQNFARAFRVQDYARVMGNMAANKARLKRVTEFASRDLTESSEIGSTSLGRLIVGLQQLLNDVEPQTVISQLQAEMPDFIEIRPLMIDILSFIERKSPEPHVRGVAEVFGARMRNLRALGQ